MLHIAREYSFKGNCLYFIWISTKGKIKIKPKNNNYLAVGLKVVKINNLDNIQWNPQKDQLETEEIKRFTDMLESMGHLKRQ